MMIVNHNALSWHQRVMIGWFPLLSLVFGAREPCVACLERCHFDGLCWFLFSQHVMSLVVVRGIVSDNVGQFGWLFLLNAFDGIFAFGTSVLISVCISCELFLHSETRVSKTIYQNKFFILGAIASTRDVSWFCISSIRKILWILLTADVWVAILVV